jgi:hypothetical protein
MATSTPQLRGLDTLDKEIKVLKQKAKKLEKEIDETFTYFQEHSGTLFVNSLFPRKTGDEKHAEGLSLGGNILYTLLENDRLRKNLGKLTSKLADKLGEGINVLMDRLFKE